MNKSVYNFSYIRIFPSLLNSDGTPVSYTEAAAIKAYITGVKEWFYLETFLNMDSNPDSDEKFHSIAVGQSFVVDNKKQDKYLI